MYADSHGRTTYKCQFDANDGQSCTAFGIILGKWQDISTMSPFQEACLGNN